MAAPAPIAVSTPRGRLAGLMLFFLGPAVVIYSAISIYPLIATMALSTYRTTPTGEPYFAGVANFVTLLTDSDLVGAVLERLLEQPEILHRPYAGAEPDRHRAGRPVEPAEPAGCAASIAR